MPTNTVNLLHATLYEVWGALQSHKALLRLEGAEKEAMIRDAIDLSWDKMKNKLANTSKIFEVSEKRRVLSHVINWLAREAERPPFQVIEREQKYRVGIGDREFHLKVDRVDRLENGTTFCMDYKTGKRVTASELTAEPLEKVQLPLRFGAAAHTDRACLRCDQCRKESHTRDWGRHKFDAGRFG